MDREIEISVPSPNARLDILQKLISKTPHEITQEELKNVAYSAHGFVGADLASVCSHAAAHAVKRTCVKDGLCGSDSVIAKVEDLLWAMTKVKPSAMREVLIEVPNVCEIPVKNVGEKCTLFFVFISSVSNYSPLTYLGSSYQVVLKEPGSEMRQPVE